MGLDDVSFVFGWELVLYDPVVAEPRTMRTWPKGGCTMGVENVTEEPFLNDDPVRDIVDIDIDEFDSILQFKRITPETASRPSEWDPKLQLKTTVSKPLTTPTRRPRTRSSGPPTILPLSEDVIERLAMKSATKSAKNPTISPPQKPKKPTKKREAPKQVEEVEAPKKKRMKKTMSSAAKYEHFLQKSVV